MTVNTSTVNYRENAPISAHGGVSPRAVAGRVSTSSTNAGALDVTSDLVILTSAGAETRTLAAGTTGQRIVIYAQTVGGTITLTLTGNPTTTDVVSFADAGDRIELIYVNSTAGWVALANNTVTIA